MDGEGQGPGRDTTEIRPPPDYAEADDAFRLGRGDLVMARSLIRMGAKFIPDSDGRMPSYIAAGMEVSEEDFIVEAEEGALEAEKPEDV